MRIPSLDDPIRSGRTFTVRGAVGYVYAIANQKGGVGKTTTAVNLGASIATAGHEVLVADLDAQCNATVALGFSRAESPSTYDCLVGGVDLAAIARPTAERRLWLAPASPDLAGAAVELARIAGFEHRLETALGDTRERFLFTLLDCPPSLGPLTVSALVAADRVLVPVQAEYFALEGLAGLLETLELIRQELNPRLEIAGMVITMHDGRTRLARDVEKELRSHFPDLVFDTVVPRSIRISEAPSFGRPVIAHAPASAGSAAYLRLAREVAARA